MSINLVISSYPENIINTAGTNTHKLADIDIRSLGKEGGEGLYTLYTPYRVMTDAAEKKMHQK